MKKVLINILILFTLFLNVTIVSAKTVDDVKCEYTLYTPGAQTSGLEKDNIMTDAKIYIIGYKDGTGGSIKIEYINDSGKTSEYKSLEPVRDWKNYESTDSYYNFPMKFGLYDKKGKIFISQYKQMKKCPSIYSNGFSDIISFDMTLYTDPYGISNGYEIKPKSEQLRNGNGSWQNPTDFYKDDSGNTTVKEDLVCSYDMEFDMYNIKTPVEFRTIYSPTDNSKTYRVSVNGNYALRTTLNDEIAVVLSQGGSEQIFIESEQLKKIFLDDKCLERTKIYHYYDMTHSRYNITTDAVEASENGAGGRYDNGDGSNDGNAGGSTPGGSGAPKPDLNFNQNTMTCAELLGSNMINVIKAAITLIRIGATIATILIGMMNFLPALTKGDAGAFNAAVKKSIWLVVVLMLIILLPVLLRTIGNLFSWDLCGIV